jgi:hypothetical protein
MVGDEEVELGLEDGEEGEDWGKGGKERKRFYKKENEEVLKRLLYATDYCSFGQAYAVCYQGYTKRGFEDRMVRAEAAGWVRIYRKYLFPERLAELDPWGLLRGPNPENRDELVKVLYLGPEGERWCRDNVRGYRKAALSKPKDNNQWTHDLTIARILAEQLTGTLNERKHLLKQYDWITGSRGARYTIAKEATASVRNLTPDAVITTPKSKKRVFLELDRSTKKIAAKRSSPHYADTILANLQAYRTLTGYQYDRFFPDKKHPYVLYIVPNDARRQAIQTLARDHLGNELELRVRTLSEGAAWIQTLFGDSIDVPAPEQKLAPAPLVTTAEAQPDPRDAELLSLKTELDQLKRKLHDKNQLIGGLRDKVADSERRLEIWKGAAHALLWHGAQARRAGEDWTVPEQFESVMTNILQAPRKKSLLGKLAELVERSEG